MNIWKAPRGYSTVSATGERLGIAPATVYAWVAKGILQGKRFGGRIIISDAVIDAMLADLPDAIKAA